LLGTTPKVGELGSQPEVAIVECVEFGLEVIKLPCEIAFSDSSTLQFR
jgi:hypothetical protein